MIELGKFVKIKNGEILGQIVRKELDFYFVKIIKDVTNIYSEGEIYEFKEFDIEDLNPSKNFLVDDKVYIKNTEKIGKFIISVFMM